MEIHRSFRADLEDDVRELISYSKVPIYRDGIVALPATYISHWFIAETGKTDACDNTTLIDPLRDP